MRVFVLHFGNGRYLPLLARFLEGWRKHSPHPVEVLTDMESYVPNGVPVTRVCPMPYKMAYYRPTSAGRAFDYKACLIMAWCAGNPAAHTRTVFLDNDNVIHGDPMPSIEDLPADRIAIGPDPGRRPIFHPSFLEPVIEESSSIIVLPALPHPYAEKYRELWIGRREDHPLLEQRTWSLVVARMGGTIAPRELAWSHRWGEPSAGTLIEHQHGERKWSEVAKWQARQPVPAA